MRMLKKILKIKKIKIKNYKKFTIGGFLVLLIIFFLGLSIKQQYMYKKEGVVKPKPEIFVQTQPLNLAFSPSSGNLAINTPHTVTLTLTTTGTNDKISGFDMTLLAGGNLQITGVGNPQATGTPTFREIIKGSTPANSVRLVYVIDELEANLPSTVEINVTVQGAAVGTGTLTINTATVSYEFVGPNPNPASGEDYVYNINASQGSYNFVAPALTPTPSGCIPEGGIGVSFNGDICCSGLTEISNASSPSCYAPGDGSFVCAYCPNEVCGPGENHCNCPQDCCVTEGGSVPVIPNPPSCCSSLTLIKPMSPKSLGSQGICTTKCGNGTCDSTTETTYNCPGDCPPISQKPTGYTPITPTGPVPTRLFPTKG